jgi:hypothetical protein
VIAAAKVERPDGGEEEGVAYEPEEPAPRPKPLKIRLADGKERTIQHMMAELLEPGRQADLDKPDD